MKKPILFVARAIFPELLEQLSEVFEVRDNQVDAVFSLDQWIEKIKEVDAVFTTGVEPINAAVLAHCTRLKIAANMTVGYNNFNVADMTKKGVAATNAPDVLTEATADMAFALLLAAARRVSESEAFLRSGQWNKWAYDMLLGAPVHKTTLGILGMGRIGQAIARRAALGFDMQIIYHNRSPLPPEQALPYKATYVSLDELLQQSDHLMIVLPYSPSVHHILDASQIAKLKPSATVVNIGRGGLIDENALANALEQGLLAAAGLDVFEGEPVVNPRLLQQKNIVLTPHIGSATEATRRAMAQLAVDNLIAFFQQRPLLTPLNPEVLSK